LHRQGPEPPGSISAVTAAIALSIVLVIAVAGTSLAMQTQRPPQVGRPRVPRPQAGPRRPPRERRAPPAPPPPPEPTVKADDRKGPELLRAGVAAPAGVLGVVDERTTGSIVRSRLNLRVEPDTGDTFEVTVRHVFASLEARSKVRVGSKIAVRFDPDDHSRVVIAAEQYPAPEEHPAPEDEAPGTSD
jgi:hypothetical protein